MTPATAATEPLLKAPELAAHLNTSLKFVYRAAEQGDIPCIKIGGKLVRFRLSEVLAALHAQQNADGAV